MGRLAFERHIHFDYSPEFMEYWNDQSPEFQARMDLEGKPYGYTGQNMFYLLVQMQCCVAMTGEDFLFYQRKGD